jgi:steroid delta-isomerase-like uncharacterized protein
VTIRSLFPLLMCILVVAVPALADVQSENKAVVQGFVAAGNNRDYARLSKYVSDDVVRHCQSTPGLEVSNLDQFIAFMKADAAVCPDSRVNVQQLVAEGDRVAIWATYTGTQEGAMGPFPPSGKEMVLEFAAIFRFEDNKIAELWVIWDNMAALSQLGHFPPKETD